MRRLGWNPEPVNRARFRMRREGLNNAATGAVLLLMFSTDVMAQLLGLLIPGNWSQTAPPQIKQAILHGLAAFGGALFVGGLLHAAWEVPTPVRTGRTSYMPALPARLLWALYLIPLTVTMLMTILILSV